MQDDPAGHGLQLLAPTREYDVPEQLVQLLAFGPENVPAEH